MVSRRALLAVLPLPAAMPASVQFIPGPSNSLVIRRNQRSLVIYGDPLGRLAKADMVLLTHARRDICWSAEQLVEGGAAAVIPTAEAALFTNPMPAWEAMYSTTRLHDYANQSTHFPARPLRNSKPVDDQEKFDWQGLKFEVIATPGYTRGAVSYLFTVDGQRLIATGDLILAGGKIADLYSLQDSIEDLKVRGYHGFAARTSQLMDSLRRIQALRPDKLIPARGAVIETPEREITLLLDRLEAVQANYLKTDAYRWYFGPENYRARARRVLGATPPAGMPYAETIEKTLPPWMRSVANSRLVVSKSGEAILIDCGSQRILDQVRAWRDEGVFNKLRAVYVTHYHDDHTDFAQAAANLFEAEVWSSTEQQDILMRPSRYRMPCLTPNPIPGLKPWRDLESRDWHEFRLQNFHFPGQTLYHGALLVQPTTQSGPSVMFVGDSFTPSGVDDYCLLNRNFLHPRQGLLYCLEIVKSHPEALLVNQHVEPLFRFSVAQIEQMQASLKQRIGLLAELFPWDEPNYGIDEQWFRLAPYVHQAKSGEAVEIECVVWNHSPTRRDFQVQVHCPEGWPATPSTILRVEPGQEATRRVILRPPAKASGLQVVTASIRFGPWDLRHWAEALVQML